MKNVILLAKKGKNNEKLLPIKNVKKTAIAEVAEVLNTINLNSKHSQAISNSNIDATKDL